MKAAGSFLISAGSLPTLRSYATVAQGYRAQLKYWTVARFDSGPWLHYDSSWLSLLSETATRKRLSPTMVPRMGWESPHTDGTSVGIEKSGGCAGYSASKRVAPLLETSRGVFINNIEGVVFVSVTGGLKTFAKVKAEIENMKKAPETVLKRLTADAKARVPRWIAAEVSKVYGVKKGEITGNKVGNMKVEGRTFKELRFIYRGRLLTPTHFNMTPKTAPAPGISYTIKATIFRGNRKVIDRVKKLTKKQRQNIGRNFRKLGTRNSPESPNMLQHTGAKDTSKVQYIPFQRRSQPGKRIHKFTTVSLPQMISGEHTRDNIQKTINEGLEKRLAHHMKLLEK